MNIHGYSVGSRFTYGRLQIGSSDADTETRIVRLVAVDPEVSCHGLIQCHLRCEKLSMSHTAVSYTWGAEKPDFTVLLNGRTFKVRRNLHEFLKVARRSHHSKPLWIDAICIDQESTTERNHQVAFMAEIYKQAFETLVWLGSGDSHLEDGLQQWPSIALPLLLEYALSTAEASQQKRLDDLKQAAKHNTFAEVWSAVSKVLILPYWNRSWIVQEYGLSPNKTLLYGSFEARARSLNQLFVGMHAKSEQGFSSFINTQVHHLCMVGHDSRSPSVPGMKLLEVYNLYRDSTCGDFHDRIYALRSLFDESTLLPVDYSLPPAQLMLSVLSFCIRDLGMAMRSRPEGLEIDRFLVAYSDFVNTLYKDFGLTLSRTQVNLEFMTDQTFRISRYTDLGIELELDDVTEVTYSMTDAGGVQLLRIWMQEIFNQDDAGAVALWHRVHHKLNNLLKSTIYLLTIHLLRRQRCILFAHGAAGARSIRACLHGVFDRGNLRSEPKWQAIETYGQSRDCTPGLSGVKIVEQRRSNKGDRRLAKLVIDDSLTGVLLLGLLHNEQGRTACWDLVAAAISGSNKHQWRSFKL